MANVYSKNTAQIGHFWDDYLWLTWILIWILRCDRWLIAFLLIINKSAF